MVELVCLTALGVVSLFTGIVSLGNSDAFMGMFTFMILLVSYALIILTFRKRRTLFKAKEVIYTGYEKWKIQYVPQTSKKRRTMEKL